MSRFSKPLCNKIGCGRVAHNTGIKKKDGSYRYRKICQQHHYEKNSMGTGVYTRHKKKWCERCGLKDKPIGRSVLTVDHKDGNRNNNALSNLQTLCWPCHRDKTATCKDWQKRNSLAKLPGF